MTSKEKQSRIETLKKQAAAARELQYNASQMLDASGVIRMGRELDRIYREHDALRAS